jgi:hypothetical protein
MRLSDAQGWKSVSQMRCVFGDVLTGFIQGEFDFGRPKCIPYKPAPNEQLDHS